MHTATITKQRIELGDTEQILKDFSSVRIDPFWAFGNKTRTETTYLTHGFHRYPAKFIPQIPQELITRYTKSGDLVVDPFCGCGTTLVEAKVAGRRSVGVDINPVAVLLSKAKTQVVSPTILERWFERLTDAIHSYNKNKLLAVPDHPRIDYWFKQPEKSKLAFLLREIEKIHDRAAQEFFLCAFSSILRGCSIWLMKSNKPTRDLEKIPSDPFHAFDKRAKFMIKRYKTYFALLDANGTRDFSCKAFREDARHIPVEDESVDLIVTSPPYVTSYEYADMHQLTALWLKHTDDLTEFRGKFLGSATHRDSRFTTNSRIADQTVSELNMQHEATANEVGTYFAEMNQVFMEAYRMLRAGGKIALVIGNTALLKVSILNAEVFCEQLFNLGFNAVEIFKREIPAKNLPSTRDEATGKFAPVNHRNLVFAYPTEYIIIFEKTGEVKI